MLAVGDFIAVGNLAFNIYRQCYLVAKGAPQEFQLLLSELTTLSTSIRLLQEECQNPESVLVRSGEDRIRMVKELLKRVENTLLDLQVFERKYAKLMDPSRPRTKQIWDKLKWSYDAADIDSLKNKVCMNVFRGLSNLSRGFCKLTGTFLPPQSFCITTELLRSYLPRLESEALLRVLQKQRNVLFHRNEWLTKLQLLSPALGILYRQNREAPQRYQGLNPEVAKSLYGCWQGPSTCALAGRAWTIKVQV